MAVAVAVSAGADSGGAPVVPPVGVAGTVAGSTITLAIVGTLDLTQHSTVAVVAHTLVRQACAKLATLDGAVRSRVAGVAHTQAACGALAMPAAVCVPVALARTVAANETLVALTLTLGIAFTIAGAGNSTVTAKLAVIAYITAGTLTQRGGGIVGSMPTAHIA